MSPRFLFDENLSFRVARALNALSRFEVSSVKDHPRLERGDDEVPDILNVCQDEGWDFVLNDLKIQEKPQEREALLDSQIGTFFVRWVKKSPPGFWLRAKTLVDRWPMVEEYALNHDPPFSAVVYQYKREIATLRRPKRDS